MASPLLTVASSVRCPHGGTAVLSTRNSHAGASSARILVEADVHNVVGCPNMRGNTASPCLRIRWSRGAAHLRLGGSPALTDGSVGLCEAGDGSPQGRAVIGTHQQRARAS